jgi:hypothetical protein
MRKEPIFTPNSADNYFHYLYLITASVSTRQNCSPDIKRIRAFTNSFGTLLIVGHLPVNNNTIAGWGGRHELGVMSMKGLGTNGLDVTLYILIRWLYTWLENRQRLKSYMVFLSPSMHDDLSLPNPLQ